MKNKKYYDLYIQTKKKILSGDFKPDEKLPSKRIAADKFGCSIITVERAYSMLEEEGYIYSKERSGYFVSRIDAIASAPSQKKPMPHRKENHA